MTERGKKKLGGGESEGHLLEFCELLPILSPVLPLSTDRAEGNLGIEYTRETAQDVHVKRRKERETCMQDEMSINVSKKSDGEIWIKLILEAPKASPTDSIQPTILGKH